MTIHKKLLTCIDVIAYLVMGLVCMGYITLYSVFAEKNIQFSFLSFPIFIGEWLIFLCLILATGKFFVKKPKLKSIHAVILAFTAFILAKSYFGYMQWGVLAFRHAALFYYLLFIFFGYFFYSRGVFKNVFVQWLIFLTIIVLMMFRFVEGDWAPSLFLLSLAIIFAQKNIKIRFLFFVAVILVTPFEMFFETARMMLVANCLACIYLTILLCSIGNLRWFVKLALAGFLLGAFLFGLWTYAGKSKIDSIVNFKTINETLNDCNQSIKAKESTYIFKEVRAAKIFNPTIVEKVEESSPDASVSQSETITERAKIDPVAQKAVESKQEEARKREYNIDINNVVFRLLIWRDMMVELRQQPLQLFGFEFGKPLRSRSLEILDWASTEWKRDGWIDPHNSYMDMIYRTGIIGLGVICFLVFTLCRMIKFFLKTKSFIGGMLCGILIIWFIAANFLSIWGLPYTAIPLWAIYGFTFAYFKDLNQHKIEGKS